MKPLIASLLLMVCATAPAADVAPLFLFKIEPLLKEKCLSCHGNDPAKLKSDYDMRTQKGMFAGGESGEKAIQPGNPEASPFYLSVTRAHEKEWKPMPPKENDKLSAEQQGWIKDWIAAGAPYPGDAQRKELAKVQDKWSAADGVVVQTSGGLNGDWTNRKYKPEGLWAYQPVTVSNDLRASTAAHAAGKGPSAIDILIERQLKAADMKPAPQADPRTLIRRITYDLTGLPPTPEEADAFESACGDRSPATVHRAVEKTVDRLLASPRYGEQMARHWLDVVRYADSSGFANDYERGNAWRYRDYVIRAFNDDKPYDQFIREQIAGDEIDPNNPELLVATGFLRMGPWELTGMEVAKIARQRFLDDVTNGVGETFLSHSLQCARCHDHKFDPVPTRDYYSMQACFATTQLVERPAPFVAAENTQGFEERRYIEARKNEHLAELETINRVQVEAARQWYKDQKLDAADFEKALASKVKTGKKKAKVQSEDFMSARTQLMTQGIPEDKVPPRHIGFTPELYGRERVARKGIERVQWELDRYEPYALAVYDGRTPEMKAVLAPLRMAPKPMEVGELEATAVLAGGDPFSPSVSVKPGVLSVLGALNPNIRKVPTPTAEVMGRRLDLAKWIANKDNTLATRSIVNRLWLWHFGQAIAGNPNNFGSTGKKPTHPELLDWLASTLVEKNWSIKAMHREIMTTDTYLRGSALPEGAAADEETKLYAAFKPRRLTAEEFRDSMLTISGELNPQLGGIPNRPEINLEAAMQPRQVMGTFAAAWQPNPTPEQRHRRSIYALKIRGQRDPLMEVLNEPAPDFSCEAREASTVTPQVFSLFNSAASYDRAIALADRVLKSNNLKDENSVLSLVFKLALGREPNADELQNTLSHWHAMTAKHEGLSFAKSSPPKEVRRDAVEENTGEKFSFNEKLHAYDDFVSDLKPSDVDARTRGLAEVCLVLLNTNEFAYLY